MATPQLSIRRARSQKQVRNHYSWSRQFFQLYDEQHADFTLGANADRLSPAERTLWLNIELYARVIREAVLHDQLEAAAKVAIARFADTENARYQRYRGATDNGDTCLR